MSFLPIWEVQSSLDEAGNVESVVREEGREIIGWRKVPTDLSSLGPTASAAAPEFRQIFIGGFEGVEDGMEIERRLYVIRKRVEHAILNSDIRDRDDFYIPSLSSRTLVYKGMLTGLQLEAMFPDLADPDLVSALALIHSRF